MTEVKQVWVVFDPEGRPQDVGSRAESVKELFMGPDEDDNDTWKDYESLGYRCLECVVKEGE